MSNSFLSITDISSACLKCNNAFIGKSLYSIEQLIKLNNDHISFNCFECQSTYFKLNKCSNKNQRIYFQICCNNIYFSFFVYGYSNPANNTEYVIDTSIYISDDVHDIHNESMYVDLSSFEDLSKYIRNIKPHTVRIKKLMILK